MSGRERVAGVQPESTKNTKGPLKQGNERTVTQLKAQTFQLESELLKEKKSERRVKEMDQSREAEQPFQLFVISAPESTHGHVTVQHFHLLICLFVC